MMLPMLASYFLYCFQFILALILIKISGAIGSLSMQSGYSSLRKAMYSGNVAFTIYYRVFFLPISLCLVSIFLLIIDFNFLAKDIWFVAIWVFIIQFILSIKAIPYTNVFIFFATGLTSIFISYIFYEYGIEKGLNYLLPDETNLATELWIITAVFFYGLLKNFDYSTMNNEIETKLENRYIALKDRFKHVINDDFKKDKTLNDLLFAVMIFEDFNRPAIFRWLENRLFCFGFVKTTGIMQVRSAEVLTDENSIILAQDILLSSHKKYSTVAEYDQVGKILIDYNPDAYYRSEVRELYYRLASISARLEEDLFGEIKPDPDLNIEDFINELNKSLLEVNEAYGVNYQVVKKEMN